MKFFRSLGVVRRLLELQQTLPTESEEKVRVVAELRALRPWELFDEGIISWITAPLCPQGAAGTQSGLRIWGLTRPTKRGSLWVVSDYAVEATVTQGASVRIGNEAVTDVTAAVVRWLDGRWAGSQGTVPVPLSARCVAKVPPLTDTTLDHWSNPANNLTGEWQPLNFISQTMADASGVAVASDSPSTDVLTIWHNEINNSVRIRVRGFLIRLD